MSRAKTRARLVRLPTCALAGLCLVLLCTLVFASPPLLVPEWSHHVRQLPLQALPVHWRTSGPADIALLSEAGAVTLITGRNERELWEQSGPEPIRAMCRFEYAPAANRLAVATARRVLMLDRSGTQVWERAVPLDPETRSMLMECGDVDGDRNHEMIVWDSRAIWSVPYPEGTPRRIAPCPFPNQPGQASLSVVDLNRDHRDEIVVFTASQVLIFDGFGQALFRDSLFPNRTRAGATGPVSAVGDLDGDGVPELVAVHCRERRFSLLFRDLADSAQSWERELALGDSVVQCGPLRVSGRRVYLAGTARAGSSTLFQLEGAEIRQSCRVEGRIDDVACGDEFVAVVFRTPLNLQAVSALSPDLKLRAQGLGYSGVRVADVVTGRVDHDGRTDLLVLRTSPTGSKALDFFRNNTRALDVEFDSARAEYGTALQGHDEYAIERAGRRLRSVAQGTGQTALVAYELDSAQEHQRHEQQKRGLKLLLFALAGCAVLAGLARLSTRLFRSRVTARGNALRRSPRDLMKICNEFIALDHIFVTKGNTTGAVNRIRELRQQLALSNDPDLYQIGDRLEPYYSRFILRLINHRQGVNFLSWLQDVVQKVRLDGSGLNSTTLTREQFDARIRNREFRGHWLVKIQNWDVPEIFERLQVYLDRRTERYLEHWLADNIRHARAWSVIVLEYTVNTMWNRKLTVHLYNDGAGRVDLTSGDTHIGTEFQEFVREYGDFFEFSKSPADLAESEKLWFRIWDFLSVLEDSYQRQTQAAQRQV